MQVSNPKGSQKVKYLTINKLAHCLILLAADISLMDSCPDDIPSYPVGTKLIRYCYCNERYKTAMARPKKFDDAVGLQKALNVFWKKGYAGTSISDLTASMDINAPSLYATYGDKHRLFLSALQAYLQSQHAWMRQSVAENKPVKDIIRLLLASLLDETLADPERRGCFMVNTITEMANQDTQVFTIAADNEHKVRSILADLIRKGQSTGEIATDKDADILASFLFINFMGIRVIAATNNDKKHLHKVLEVILSAI
jgi:TetR/AcrR family transcriptional regulator, transcriptional repressor for nem operon